jgi:hypothetical protein
MRLTSGCLGGSGERSVAPSSMITRLKRTPCSQEGRQAHGRYGQAFRQAGIQAGRKEGRYAGRQLGGQAGTWHAGRKIHGGL